MVVDFSKFAEGDVISEVSEYWVSTQNEFIATGDAIRRDSNSSIALVNLVGSDIKADQEVEAFIDNLDSANRLGFFVRGTTGVRGGYALCMSYNFFIRLFKIYSTGNIGQIGEAEVPDYDEKGRTLKLKIEGQELKAYVNDELVLDGITDEDYTSGGVGLFSHGAGTGGRIYNFKVSYSDCPSVVATTPGEDLADQSVSTTTQEADTQNITTTNNTPTCS